MNPWVLSRPIYQMLVVMFIMNTDDDGDYDDNDDGNDEEDHRHVTPPNISADKHAAPADQDISAK